MSKPRERIHLKHCAAVTEPEDDQYDYCTCGQDCKVCGCWFLYKFHPQEFQATVCRWCLERGGTAPAMSKAAYVLAQPQSRPHRCHWPGCMRQVPPAMWGCKPHWYTLPQVLRDRIWGAYLPGQEITGRPSRKYVHVARQVQQWIEEYEQEHAK